MRKKKCSAEVCIDTSCPPPTFEDYHRFTMLDPRTNYKGYTLHNWFPASTRDFVIDKLGQLEDIEDELGIDLITVFKALKEGCWTLYNGRLDYHGVVSIQRSRGKVRLLYGGFYTMNIEDYGKTWALTKEELL